MKGYTFMTKKSLPQTPRELELDATSKVIECGTLALLTASLHVQPVLLMPLTRTIQRGSLTVQQYVVHVTASPSSSTLVLYSTFRAAEIARTLTGMTLTTPYPFQAPLPNLQIEAQRLQRELEACMTRILTSNPRVSKVIAPARYRLPDLWIWQAECTDPQIVCVDRSWKLIEEVRRG
jgi:hypothetical protein